MTESGVYTDARTLRFERRLPGAIEQVWAYLVEPHRLAVWLARGEIEPRVGGQVVIHHEEVWPNSPPARGVVTAWDPPRRLAYTWCEASTVSEVAFELTPADVGVALVLTHRLLPIGEETGFGAGWHVGLDALALALRDAAPGEIAAALKETPDLRKFYATAIAEARARHHASSAGPCPRRPAGLVRAPAPRLPPFVDRLFRPRRAIGRAAGYVVHGAVAGFPDQSGQDDPQVGALLPGL